MTTAEYMATCGSGDSVGGGASQRGGVGQRETRRSGQKALVVPAMFAPNPEVLARRAVKARAGKRDADTLRDGSAGAPSGAQAGGGGIAQAVVGLTAASGIVVDVHRCCCDADDCLGDVSDSQHFCSKTNRRVFAWCQQAGCDEGFGSASPCIRCAAKEPRKG